MPHSRETRQQIVINDLNFYYGAFYALKKVSVAISKKRITALIGPSGCGKSTLLRCLNRMNDLIPGTKTEGEIFISGENILAPDTKMSQLRKKVGMVFQRPNPFPLSVFDNVAFGPTVHGTKRREGLHDHVEHALRSVNLWDELKDRLTAPALELSGEQQQRLCIARLVAVEPDILLMDEPCSALDPVATQRIEELMAELKKNYTVVIVTHNMQQAARVSDDTGYMLLGELIEFGRTDQVFTNPRDSRTNDYITGRFG